MLSHHSGRPDQGHPAGDDDGRRANRLRGWRRDDGAVSLGLQRMDVGRQFTMSFASCVPQPPLSDYVSVFWIAQGYAVPHAQERLLPTGAMDLVIGLDDDNRTGSGISGARSEFAVLDTSRPCSMIGAHFKPGGGFPFFSPPAGELQNLGVPLDAVWGRYAVTVREQLLEATTSEARFRILERALLEKSSGRRGRHPAVRFALKDLG